MALGHAGRDHIWVFGLSTFSNSAVDSDDLPALAEYADATTGLASTSASGDVGYTYDNLGAPARALANPSRLILEAETDRDW